MRLGSWCGLHLLEDDLDDCHWSWILEIPAWWRLEDGWKIVVVVEVVMDMIDWNWEGEGMWNGLEMENNHWCEFHKCLS